MSARIWVVDDDRSVRFVLATALREAGYRVDAFENADDALTALHAQGPPDVLFTDVRMPGDTGLALLDKLKALHPQLPVIVMSAYTDIASTAGAFRGGAYEFLSKPFDLDDAVALAARALPESVPAATTPRVADRDPDDRAQQIGPQLIGAAPAMRALFRSIGRLAQAPPSVLVTGETGTGKELVARALHRESPRARKPFITLNTAAIPSELLESELFGHEAGAFTGASKRHVGRFEQADGGTLFLDEIGELPLEAQARLLRVLQEGEIRRVGSVQSQKVDVRLIAATHRDLKSLAKIGQFREDLYYRLHVIALKLPALRERGADVNEIAQAFLLRQSARINRTDLKFAPDAEQVIRHYSWPGNVRELENAVERAVILSESPEISAELLGIDIELSDLDDDDFIGLAPQQGAGSNTSHEPTEDLSLEDYFQHFVLEHQDHMTETELARKLGVSRKCLWERRQRLGIPRRKTGVASES